MIVVILVAGVALLAMLVGTGWELALDALASNRKAYSDGARLNVAADDRFDSELS